MRHRSAAALALASPLLLAAPAPAVAQTGPVPAERQFQDWITGCDNTRSCVTVGMTAEDGPQTGFVHFERAGAGEAAPAVHLVLFDDTLAPGRDMAVTLDGAPIPGIAERRPVEAVADFDGYVATTLTRAEVAPFVDALRHGSRLKLANPDGDSAVVSLKGAMAALLSIDDVQGRVGTTTALARAGTRPASAITPPPAPPVVQPHPAPMGTQATPELATRLRARWQKEGKPECEQREDADFEMDDVSPLDGGRSLVAISCSAGAYNYEIVFAVVDGTDVAHAKPASFPMPAVEGTSEAEQTDRLINGGFDPASGRVGFFAKGRGLGDCGSSGEYAWTGDGFALLSWRMMPECRGVPEPYWPVLWRTDAP